MTTPHSWARNTLGRSFDQPRACRHSAAASGVFVLAALAGAATAATLEDLAKEYRSKPLPAARDALRQYAAAQRKSANGPVAQLALAVADLEHGRYDDAANGLRDLNKRLSSLEDFLAWWSASAEYGRKDYAATLRELDPVWRAALPSPVLGRSAMLAARAHLEMGQGAEAAQLLQLTNQELFQPQGDLLLGRALEAAGDLPGAANALGRVWYRHPMSDEAKEAEPVLSSLRTKMGATFPSAPATDVFERAEKLARSGEAARAVRELNAFASTAPPEDRDLALVRVGVVRYMARQTREALAYLRPLEVSSPAADAERLYHVYAAARRMGRDEDCAWALEELGRSHPVSQWRLEALVSAGNRELLENREEGFTPHYAACASEFPSSPQAMQCDWKLTWAAWLRRRPDAADKLLGHLRRYPASDKASAALYFLGRNAETEGDHAAARAFYSEIGARYPNSYYTLLASARLSEPSVRSAVRSERAAALLKSIAFPSRGAVEDFSADEPARQRIERARLLRSAALDDFADQELRYAARRGVRPVPLAMELAEAALRAGEPDRALRYIKGMVPGYLGIPTSQGPRRFWELAFPLPYREPLERYAEQSSLDPYLLAGMIRQESEFNKEAVSRADARGLTQVMPRTGRELSRKVGMKRFTTKMLFDPEVNLRLGTYYFRTLGNSLEGNWEATLAAYNGGKSRVDRWLQWGPFREPAEFIESIPITETREYVMVVQRNGAIYRRLYENQPAPVSSSVSSAKPPAKAKGKNDASKNIRRSGAKSKRAPAVPKR